jgi:hypothetical protein
MQIFIAPTEKRELIANRVRQFILDVMPGKRIKITVERYVKSRSNPQCRWLNGVAYKALSDLTGYSRDDISEYMNGKYYGWKQEKCPKTPNNPKGVKDVPIRTTTTDENGNRKVQTTLEFEDYKMFVQKFGAEHGVQIPDPNEESDALRSA